jgi:hypothetical protein
MNLLAFVKFVLKSRFPPKQPAAGRPVSGNALGSLSCGIGSGQIEKFNAPDLPQPQHPKKQSKRFINPL